MISPLPTQEHYDALAKPIALEIYGAEGGHPDMQSSILRRASRDPEKFMDEVISCVTGNKTLHALHPFLDRWLYSRLVTVTAKALADHVNERYDAINSGDKS